MSISVLRLIPKTCGLFDTGFTGVNQTELTSVKGADLTTIDPSDILTNKDENFCIGDVIQSNIDNFSIDDGFAEEFLDLSEFLFPGKDMDVDAVFPLDIGDEGRSVAVKRKAGMIDSSGSIPAPNPDHNDYTSKRPRLESDSCDEGTRSRLMSYGDSDVSDCNVTSSSSGRGQKYRERRDKNNVASKRSRATRKQKYVNMEETASKLERENEELRQRALEMEKLTKEMKAILVKRLAHGK